jgi:hypothetical protein
MASSEDKPRKKQPPRLAKSQGTGTVRPDEEVAASKETLKLGSAASEWGRKQLEYLCVDLIHKPFDINREVLKLDSPPPEIQKSNIPFFHLFILQESMRRKNN